ncbi:hypothetical protein KR018_008255, partial [Drosophila ironensis]
TMRTLGPREKLHLLVGGQVCEVYRDSFNSGSSSYWGVAICLILFIALLIYYHLHRDRIHPAQ